MQIPYQRESSMYPAICNWLLQFLADRFPNHRIRIAEASHQRLSRFISNKGWQNYFDAEWVTWDIRVDVVGFIIGGEKARLAFVECKNRPINLRDISQLLGYSRVARPLYSFLLSPAGFSDAVIQLIQTYGRRDVLEYLWKQGDKPRSIVLAKWDILAASLAAQSVLPPGAL